MSWAPRLISLSSSGKRNDSVSRESSVHSMTSMNCFLRKSMIAITEGLPVQVESYPAYRLGRNAALFLRRKPLRLGIALSDLGFELRRRQRARDHGAVREDEGRRGGDLHLLPQLVGCRDRVVAVAVVLRKNARIEELVPCLDGIERAPDLLRLSRRIRVQLVDRVEEGVDRDVVDALELLLEARTIRAVRIGEDRHLALAVALDPLEGEIERQAVERYARVFALLRFGQVLLRRSIVDASDDNVSDLRVGVDELIVELHLVEAEVRRLAYVADVHSGEALLEELLDGGRLGAARLVARRRLTER